MLKKFALLTLTFLILVLVTAACASSDNIDTALRYLEAVNTGDVETTRALACEGYEEDIVGGLMDVTEEEREQFSFQNVTCRAQGEDVECSFNIAQEGTDLRTAPLRTVVFNFEDGRICGFEEQVAQ